MGATRRYRMKIRRQWDMAMTRLKRKLRAGKVDLDQIPDGTYCYRWGRALPDGRPDPASWHLCPYWDANPTKPDHEYGYCKLLELGDWMVGFGLLWDQVKECGLKRDYPEEE